MMAARKPSKPKQVDPTQSKATKTTSKPASKTVTSPTRSASKVKSSVNPKSQSSPIRTKPKTAKPKTKIRQREVAPAIQPTAMAREFTQNALGIDISRYQPEVNWPQVKSSGVSFAYIKATEGTTITDPMFANHWPNAHTAGILRGAYHFFRPGEDPVAQAQCFVNTLGAGSGDLPPALDLEVSGTRASAPMLAASITDIQTWLMTVERLLGVRPVIYTNLDSWGRVVQLLGGNAPDWISRYPLWAASWVYHYTDGDQPTYPPGWSQWAFWQFDSPDKPNGTPLVSVAGIPGGVDLNLFHGNEAALRAWGSGRQTSGTAKDQRPKTVFHGNNQDVINVFYFAFGVDAYWGKLETCELTYLVNDRTALYTGPAVEDLPNLAEADRQALRAILIPATNWPQFGFQADHTIIQAGETVQFSWQVSDGVDEVHFWNGTNFEPVGGSDRRTVAPTVSAEYYLKVVAKGGQSYWSDRIQIDVRAASGPSTGQPLLGLHMLVNDPFDAGNRGCRFVMYMHPTPARANEFKRAFPTAVVMYRHFLERNQNISPQRMFELLQVAPDSELVYTGQNEGDQSPYGTPEQIRLRAAFDVAVAQLVKAAAPKSIYAAGSFATLNPDFREPEICQALREGYAAAYNSGLIGFDMHLYSRDFDHIFGGDLIDETNWYHLFTQCGFDPRRRAIYAGETGIDDVLGVRPGKEGFRGLEVSPSSVVAWMRRWLEVQARPISVDGTLYPSPFVGGAIFQCGGNGDPQWNPYDMSGYLDAMREVWHG